MLALGFFVAIPTEPICRIAALPESLAEVCSATSQVGEGLVLGCKGNNAVREREPEP